MITIQNGKAIQEDGAVLTVNKETILMKIIEVNDYKMLSQKSANLLAAQILMKPACVLGLATGSTPTGTYQELICRYKLGDLDFSQVTTINLDEYCGLSVDNPQSYRFFMDRELFSHVNIDKGRTHVPDGMEADPDKACAEYEKLICQVGGIDLQLLGIGENGHIGFNEPAGEFVRETHCVFLTESTRKANARFFPSLEKVPESAYTMGIGTIMAARKIVLLASGETKADAVYRACFGPVSPHVPASVLQLHPDVTVIADREALSAARIKGVYQ